MSERRIQARGVLVVAFCLAMTPSALRADCGCEAISVRSGRGGPTTSRVYCTQDEADIDDGCQNLGKGVEGCGDDAYAYRCTLGPLSFEVQGDQRVGWGFEIAVTLTPGSAPKECDHAQLATRTATVDVSTSPNQSAEDEPEDGEYELQGGPTIEVVAGPVPYPRFGTTNDEGQPILGADGYTEDEPQSNLSFHAEPPQITWIDTPDFNWDREADEQGAASWEFIQWVDAADEETGDNCWCRFTIERSWDGVQAGGAGLRFVAGRSCALATG